MAFGLMAWTVDDALEHFYALAQPYGRNIVIFVLALLWFQFVIAVLTKILQDVGKNISNEEKLGWYKTYLRTYTWLNVISAVLALVVTSTSFTIYKALIVGAEGYGLDATFIAWDRMIFGGNDGWVLTHRVFDTATATMWLDFLYHPTFLPMIVLYLFSITPLGLNELRQTYMLSFLAGFVVIGMIGASAMHSAGPVFDGVLYGDGGTFGPLMDGLQIQLAEGGGPVYADPIRQYLLHMHNGQTVQMGAGISAMPSMHMVWVFLWVFAAWNLSHILGLIMALYAGIIWIASVHLGWHYFVDGLVSLVMIGIIWRVAGHIVGLYGRATFIRATA